MQLHPLHCSELGISLFPSSRGPRELPHTLIHIHVTPTGGTQIGLISKVPLKGDNRPIIALRLNCTTHFPSILQSTHPLPFDIKLDDPCGTMGQQLCRSTTKRVVQRNQRRGGHSAKIAVPKSVHAIWNFQLAALGELYLRVCVYCVRKPRGELSTTVVCFFFTTREERPRQRHPTIPQHTMQKYMWFEFFTVSVGRHLEPGPFLPLRSLCVSLRLY